MQLKFSEIYSSEKVFYCRGKRIIKICKLITSHPIKINEGHEYSSQQKKNEQSKAEKSSALNGKHAILGLKFCFTYSGKNEENTHLLLGN